MKVVGWQFTKRGQPGDFVWMLGQQGQYDDALFIFNDNEEQFLAYLRDPRPGTSGCADGGGNAAIRHYRCEVPPRAAGIPTGSRGQGYPELTAEVQSVIDQAFAVVKDVLAHGHQQQVFYSAANDHGDLGTGIFRVGDDVKRYIVTQLQALGD